MTKHQDTSETINNLGGLTLGHLIQIMRKLKITALLSIFAVFSSIIGGAYALGKNSQQKDTAVMLQSPFSMRLEEDGKKFDFQNLTLMKDPMLTPTSENTIILSLREIKSDFDVIPVGLIVARSEIEKLSWPWSLFSLKDIKYKAAYAADKSFNWNGHNNDFSYTEEFVNSDTVHRCYEDGCVLEYKVDANRKSIPETFRWLKSVH